MISIIYKRLADFRAFLLGFACFFCGPLFAELPASDYFSNEFGPVFGSFLALFLFWELTLGYISFFIFRRRGGKSRVFKVLSYLPAFVLSIICFYWLGHLEQKVPEYLFFVTLGLLGLRAVSVGFKLNGFDSYSLIISMLFFAAIAVYSSFLLTSQISWQFILLAFALVPGFASPFLIREHAASLRLNTIILFLSPVIILFMAYMGYLERKYLYIFISLLPVMYAAEKGRAIEKMLLAEDTAKLKQNISLQMQKLERLSCYSSITFVLALFILVFIR